MFQWLKRLFAGRSTQTRREATVRARPASVQAVTEVVQGQPAAKETHLELLTREAGELTLLSLDDARLVSELAEIIVAHLSTHTIEPPVMPALASRMLELLREPEVDIQMLARLVERDQATAAKLMTIANSAVFKGQSDIATVRDAVVQLGTEQVARIVIGLATRAMFEGATQGVDGGSKVRWSRLFFHSMTTAFAACELVTQKHRRHSEAAFLGGLFHDVGKAVALRALTDVMRYQSDLQPSERVIDAALHLVHSDSTSVMYENWRFPRSLMAMCTSHHRLTVDVSPELHFVRLVSGLDALRNGSGIDKREALTEIAESSAALRMTDAELRVADTATRQYAERMTQMFR